MADQEIQMGLAFIPNKIFTKLPLTPVIPSTACYLSFPLKKL